MSSAWQATRATTQRSELISNVGGWSASDKVILASGANYPDALSASALAGAYDAPIILTDPTELSSKAAATIKQLGPSTIYVVGGPSAVSDEVLQAANNYMRKQYDSAIRLNSIRN